MCPPLPPTSSLSACSFWHVCMTCVLSGTNWIHSTFIFWWFFWTLTNKTRQLMAVACSRCLICFQQQYQQQFLTRLLCLSGSSLVWHSRHKLLNCTNCPSDILKHVLNQLRYSFNYEEIKLSLSVPTLYPKSHLQDKVFISGLCFGLTLFSYVSLTNSCCGGCVTCWSEHFHAIYLLRIWCLKGLQLHFCGLSCEQSGTQALISIIGNTCISSTISSHNGSCEKDR